MIRITSQEMQDFSRYIAEMSGIAIDPGKKYLLENRLQPVLDEQRCSSFYELLFSVKNGENIGLRSSVIDAVATNETYFFRDQTPFDVLRYKIIPDIIDRQKRQGPPGKAQIRIWCAGCSTGQEVYSVIIAIMETVPDLGAYDIRVLGTDISSRVVAQASSGRYSQHEVGRGLPPGLLRKYFVEEQGAWRVRDEVRLLAGFSRMNLLEPFYGMGPFDIIFCRNVSIYFSEQNKIELFKKIARVLDRDGYLIVGGSESLSEVAPQFTCHRHLKGMYYQRKDAVPETVPARRAAAGPPAVPEKREAGGSGPSSLQGGRIAAHAGSGAGSRDATRAGRGAKTAGEVSGPAQQQGETDDAHREKAFLPRAEHGAEGSRFSGARAAAATASPLFADDGKGPAGEEQPLLAAILNRQRQERPSPALERKRQGEGQRSLLEIIRDNSEKNEAGRDESDSE